ncbi:major capsid protein, partial [Myxococcota bacterium]|nr:major capsid protein [Myxococcota bacterium]
GDNFFDDLLAHKEVRETYKGWSEAQILRESYIGPNRSSYGIFEFGGIVFENYRGASIPDAKSKTLQTYIGTDNCHLFPLGVPGLFKTAYAPADYEETVNTLGRRLYSRQYPMQNGKGRHLDSQMNALQYCSRPKALISGRRT